MCRTCGHANIRARQHLGILRSRRPNKLWTRPHTMISWFQKKRGKKTKNGFRKGSLGKNSERLEKNHTVSVLRLLWIFFWGTERSPRSGGAGAKDPPLAVHPCVANMFSQNAAGDNILKKTGNTFLRCIIWIVDLKINVGACDVSASSDMT